MKGLSLTEPMVKAWLEGRKSVTRRLMNPQPDIASDGCIYYPHRDHPKWRRYENDKHFRRNVADDFPPRYLPGETVYIKETWSQSVTYIGDLIVGYKADGQARTSILNGPVRWMTLDDNKPLRQWNWKSPRFMPEWASRGHALIGTVGPERVQEITEAAAIMEGFLFAGHGDDWKRHDSFRVAWDTLHPGSWEANSWVWRIELEKLW
uniref:Uncharacterized protein n=1 Tax=viral metagenome TaxID=1070528 RepID=A0A6M3JJE8_9ZZZZ